MKKLNLLLSSVLFGCYTAGADAYLSLPEPTYYFYENSYVPRLLLTGFAGASPLARADLLFPFSFFNNDGIAFGNVQGEYGKDEAGYLGAGVGYRRIINPCTIMGAYLYFDENYSTNHNTFEILSPGVEALGHYWDVRVNGYIPVSRRTEVTDSFVLGGLNTCGINVDCQFTSFQGHQQFGRRFESIEQVGPGVDGEFGVIIPQAHGLRLHAGGYYFHLADFKDVKGVEGRIEFPINRKVMFTAESSFDTQQRGRIVAGLQFAIGGSYADPRTIYARLEDPVIRNIGTVGRGNGIPILSKQNDRGLALVRDNIFFFSPTGTATLGSANFGTFENPLAPNQFSQATVDNVFITTGNGNFYFATGTYTIAGPNAPNQVVTLHDRQGLFGRSEDFRCSAVGTERPTLLGGLVFEGHNTLDSMQLINNLIHTGDGRVVAIDMVDAIDNHICNSLVVANAVVEDDFANASNIAIGIHANNSSATIQTSTIEANAILFGSGDNVLNAAVGIGAIGGNAGIAGAGTNGIDATIIVTGGNGEDGLDEQGEAGLSETVTETTLGGIDGLDSSVLDTFNNNNFVIHTSNILGSATVAGSLLDSVNAGVAVGAIGGLGGTGGAAGSGGILDVSVTSGSGGNGLGPDGFGGAGGDAHADVVSGDGGDGGAATATANFDNNELVIAASNLLGEAIVQNTLSDFAANLAVGIGAIGGSGGTGGLGGVGGALSPVAINANGGGIGVLAGTGGPGGVASATLTSGDGGTGGDAFALATFNNNLVTLTAVSVDAVASTGVINNSLNAAVGIGALAGLGGIGADGSNGGDISLATNSGDGGDADGEGSVGGAGGNTVANLTSGGGGAGGSAESNANFDNNILTIFNSDINAEATVQSGTAELFSINAAIGIGAAGGLSGFGGNGAVPGDLVYVAFAGDGGDGTNDGVAGNGGLITTIANSGRGGAGGVGSLGSSFSSNTLSVNFTTVTVTALAPNLDDSANIAIGLGVFGGQAGEGGVGGTGNLLFSAVTAGDGGAGVTGTGGNGGNAFVTLSSDPTGQGGPAATLSLFTTNSISLNQVDFDVIAQALSTSGTFGSLNAAVAIGAIAGNGGFGGDGGFPPTVINTPVNGVAGPGANGGAGGLANVQILPILLGSGGNATNEADFIDNTLTLTNSSLFATATLLGDLDIGFNASVLIGGLSGFPGVDGLQPVGGGLPGTAQTTGNISANIITINGLTGVSRATVDNTILQSVNEAIGMGTDVLLGVNSLFEDNFINSSNADLGVFATINGTNNATNINKALGLFAGDGTVINYFNGNLTVLAQVLGVNLGTNITALTETSGSGTINF